MDNSQSKEIDTVKKENYESKCTIFKNNYDDCMILNKYILGDYLSKNYKICDNLKNKYIKNCK